MLPRDASDQLHEPRRTTWALWIILIVLIVFGTFWYIEHQKAIIPPPLSTQPATSFPLDTLQASVIQSEIPDFSEGF